LYRNLKDNIINHWNTTLIQQDLPNLSVLNTARNIYWKPDQLILSLPNLQIIYLLFDLFEDAVDTLQCYLIRNNVRLFNSNYTFLENFSSGIQKKIEPNSILINPDDCWYQKFFFQDVTYWDVIDASGFYFHCKLTVRQYNRSLKKSIKTYNVTPAINIWNEWYYIKRTFRPYCWRSIQLIHIMTLVEGICTMVFNLIVIITTLR
jgi:hypothetical protein